MSEARARIHAALGDESRLALVDLLVLGDLSVQELGRAVDLPGNLLAHHLNVLESAELITRRVSEGDRRRRYIVINHDALSALVPTRNVIPGSVFFVCSHNSARSQYAAAKWEQRTGTPAVSAGSEPAERVNATAVRIAAEVGLDLSSAMPQGYDSIDVVPDLLVSVCDRARESELPKSGGHLHWSIPDPVAIGRVDAFRQAFSEIDARIEALL
ncbi:MAG: ArsR family transcriptional regulator [Acidimicrobiia bacterium]